MKYLKNWILERLASNIPVPSWRAKLHRMRGVNIGQNVYIGYDVIFDRIHPELITVGDYAEIGDRCILSAHSRGSLTTRQAYPRTTEPIKIGRGALVNSACIITQGVEIGENSIIGIGSVVTRDISPNSLALGYPAKVIKKLEGVGELKPDFYFHCFIFRVCILAQNRIYSGQRVSSLLSSK